MIAFSQPEAACRFCVTAQHRLLTAEWPEQIFTTMQGANSGIQVFPPPFASHPNHSGQVRAGTCQRT